MNQLDQDMVFVEYRMHHGEWVGPELGDLTCISGKILIIRMKIGLKWLHAGSGGENFMRLVKIRFDTKEFCKFVQVLIIGSLKIL